MWMTATSSSSSERRRNAAESAGAAALGLDGFQLLDSSQRHRPAGPRLVPLFAWSQQLHSDRCDVDLAVVSADPPRCRRSCTAPRAPRRRKSMLNSTSASSFPVFRWTPETKIGLPASDKYGQSPGAWGGLKREYGEEITMNESMRGIYCCSGVEHMQATRRHRTRTIKLR